MSSVSDKLKKSPKINRRFKIHGSQHDSASETEFIRAYDKNTAQGVALHYDPNHGSYDEGSPSDILANEIKVLTALNGLRALDGGENPHIQGLVDVVEFSDTVLPVVQWPVLRLERSNGGETLEQISRERLEFFDKSKLPEGYAEWVTSLTPEKVVEGVCDALGYIHEHGIYHNWLKNTSIGFFEDNTVKLMHFGYAGGANKKVPFGFSRYSPPELKEGGISTPQSDLYMLGSTLFVFFSGTLP
ncbi:hypothetical protein KY360_04865, partial [Candidatus Woesearchaeota archaeon]|nr:hypothetical protein [Candidatus Woesearchaeota archaeon]